MAKQKKTAKKKNGKKIDIDEMVRNGNLEIDELDTLKLQKLLHQAQSLATRHDAMKAQVAMLSIEAQKKAQEFKELAGKIHEKYGLKEYHAIDLSDERGGLVIVQEQQQLIPNPAPPVVEWEGGKGAPKDRMSQEFEKIADEAYKKEFGVEPQKNY